MPPPSWQHEEAAAASLAPGVADLLQGHLCGIGCMHEAPADEPTQVNTVGGGPSGVVHAAPAGAPARAQPSGCASQRLCFPARPASEPAPAGWHLHPPQAEYAGAVRESYQLLQGAVQGINGALEEVREARADLLEEA